MSFAVLLKWYVLRHAQQYPHISDATQVQMDVECKVVRDVLKGDDVCEIKVHLKDYLKDEMPVGED